MLHGDRRLPEAGRRPRAGRGARRRLGPRRLLRRRARGAAGARSASREVRLGLIPATIGPFAIARIGREPGARAVPLGRALRRRARAAHRARARARGRRAALDAAVERAVAALCAARPLAVAHAKACVASRPPATARRGRGGDGRGDRRAARLAARDRRACAPSSRSGGRLGAA